MSQEAVTNYTKLRNVWRECTHHEELEELEDQMDMWWYRMNREERQQFVRQARNEHEA